MFRGGRFSQGALSSGSFSPATERTSSTISGGAFSGEPLSKGGSGSYSIPSWTAWAGFGNAASLRDHFRVKSPPVSRRDQIKLSDAELAELLESERVAVVSSIGPRGWPHSMPLWFVPREGVVWVWTYAKSQKVRNLERDRRATVLIETGHDYGELRGAMIEAEAEIHRDFETVLGFAEELTVRYAEGISSVRGDAKAGLEAQAPKRVAIAFRPLRTATWDHRKLGGAY